MKTKKTEGNGQMTKDKRPKKDIKDNGQKAKAKRHKDKRQKP
jgi:hypothetical protein